MPILPFPERAATKRTWWQRLRNECPAGTVLASIYQLLAEAPSVQSVTAEAVTAILREQRWSDPSRLEPEFGSLYRQYLRHCLADRFLSNDEIADLAHLASILGLSEAAVTAAQEEVARQLYGWESAAAVEDGRVDAVEREWLDYLRHYVRLPDDDAQAIFAGAADRAYRKFLEAALADRQLSPEEEIQLTRIAASLGVTVPADAETLQTLERYRLFWRLEHMALPAIDGRAALADGEVLHWEEAGSAEPVPPTDAGPAHGEPARVSRMSGWFWRSARYRNRGALAPKLDPVAGLVSVTSHHMLFGGTETVQLPLAGMTVEPISDGVWVRQGEASWIFRTAADAEVFHRILARAIRDAESGRTPVAARDATAE